VTDHIDNALLRHEETLVSVRDLARPIRMGDEKAGMKFDGEKPRMDLLVSDMPRALEAIGHVLTAGAEKYAPGNWQYVENADSRYLAAALRHEMALARGEQNDPETGVHHLAHVVCCVLFRLELAMREAAR